MPAPRSLTCEGCSAPLERTHRAGRPSKWCALPSCQEQRDARRNHRGTGRADRPPSSLRAVQSVADAPEAGAAFVRVSLECGHTAIRRRDMLKATVLCGVCRTERSAQP